MRKLLLALCLLSLGCGDAPQLVRIIESPVIDSLLGAAPVSLIDIDALPADTLYPDAQVAQAADSLEDVQFMSAMVIAGDSIYMGDMQLNAIFVAAHDGPLRKRLGREGRGPGEFQHLLNLTSNEKSIFTLDSGRMQELTFDLKYVGSKPWSGSAGFGRGELAASDIRIYIPCGYGAEYRICHMNAEKPYEMGEPFVRSVAIQQPPMNSFAVATGPNRVYGVFKGLPYVFVFDENHGHIQTIRFHGDAVTEHADEYTVDGVPPGSGVQMGEQRTIGLRPILSSPITVDSLTIAVPIGGVWYFIEESRRGKFTNTRAVTMIYRSKRTGEERAVYGPSSVEVYNGHLYVRNSWTSNVLRYSP